ncbi:hypothetical protein N9V16_07010 [SAR116 cluster bacterium]|nr:hypothetical protein [SAR116 cluster bacterium]
MFRFKNKRFNFNYENYFDLPDFFELKERFSPYLKTYSQIIVFVFLYHLYPAISLYSWFSNDDPFDWLYINNFGLDNIIILYLLYAMLWFTSFMLMMTIFIYLAAIFTTIFNFTLSLIVSLWSYLKV